jgi:hypothetical protein
MDHNIHHLRLAGTVASGEKADASVNHWANVLNLFSGNMNKILSLNQITVAEACERDNLQFLMTVACDGLTCGTLLCN